MQKVMVLLMVAASVAAFSLANAQTPPAATAPAASAPSASGTVDPAKVADIRKLMELTGAGEQARQAISNLLNQLRQRAPQVDDKFVEDIMKEVKIEELLDIMVPVYDRHLTHDDVKAQIAFYSSPAGQRVLKAQPGIAADRITVQQGWVQKINQKIRAKLMEKTPPE